MTTVTEAPEVPITSIEAKDLQYCTNQNYPVKINRATVSLEPVADGKLLSFTFWGFTDEVIPGGEMIIDLLENGVQFHVEKYNLSDGVLQLPISAGNFVLPFSQVLPATVRPGNYGIKLKLLNQDGRQLSWVILDFTIPFDPTINFPGGGRGRRGGRGGRGPTISFPGRGGRGPTISFEFV